MAELGVLAAFAYLALMLLGVVFLVALIVAPFKLYGIHREIRYTNELLKHQSEWLQHQDVLLTEIEKHIRKG